MSSKTSTLRVRKIIFLFLAIFTMNSCWEKSINTEIYNKVNSWTEINILALWDSLTYWYNLEKEDSYPSQLEVKLQENWYKYNIINLWINWNTSKQLFDRIDNILEDNVADIAILTIWWNDWLRKQSVSDMKENILAIIDKLEKKNVHIVFTGVKLPILLWWNYSSSFERVYEEISEEKNVYFYPSFLEWIWLSAENNMSDNIHPTAKWYTIISNNIYEFLEESNLLYKQKN